VVNITNFRAGLVENASSYVYSSASNYVNDSGLLKIKKADKPIIDILDSNAFVKYNQQ
jgi:hypothetical protein